MTTIHENSTYDVAEDKNFRKFFYHDPYHTPYNKKFGEVISTMDLMVNAHKRTTDWLEITTTETRTTSKGIRGVTHHLTLREEQAIALRDMLNEQFPK